MPLSVLIVHCSKAAFIKMIKHSQTTAKYLKASSPRYLTSDNKSHKQPHLQSS